MREPWITVGCVGVIAAVLVGAIVAWLLWVVARLIRERLRNATMVEFVNMKGERVMEVKLKVGGSARLRALLKRDDGSIDDSFEGAAYAFANGTLESEDGSVTAEVDADGLTVAVTGVKASAIVDGAAVPAVLTFKADSDATRGEQFIGGALEITVEEDNATHVEFEVVPEP